MLGFSSKGLIERQQEGIRLYSHGDDQDLDISAMFLIIRSL